MKQKTVKTFLIVFGVISIILFVLPIIAKHYAIDNSKTLVGRQIDINKLKVNYFTGTVSVIDFKMLESNEVDHFIAFDTLIVNLEPLQLFKDNIEIEALYLKGLDVKVSMKDSMFNFDDIITFFNTKKKDTTTTSSATYKYNFSNIEIKGSNFHFDNQNINDITEIENVSITLPYVGWNQKEKSNANLKFNFPKGGFLASKVNINPIDGDFDAQFTLSNLQLESFYKYIAEHAEINNFKGVLNSEIHLEGNTFDALKTTVSGKLQLNNIAMTDRNDQLLIAAQEIDAKIKTVDLYNHNYVIDSLKLNAFYTFVQLDSTTNNLVETFKLNTHQTEVIENTNQTPLDSSSINKTQKPDLHYSINHFQLNNSSLDYTDNLTGTPFNYHLNQIEVSSDSIKSESQWIDIYANMRLNNRGTLNAKLGFNPQSTKQANIDISIEKFLLSDLNIYSNYYTGHSVIKGDMFYTSKSILTAGKLESENNLLVKNVSLANSKSGLYSIPLKFAIFLLKDKNGDVNLDIPVRGDLNDPSIEVRKIVWNTFKNNIIKIAASPGKLLSNLVGGDPKDIEELTFEPTDSILSQNHINQLDKLLKIEQQKEELKIELVYYADQNLQKLSIAKQEAVKLYLKETEQKYLKSINAFEAYVYSKRAVDSFSLDQTYIVMATPKIVDSIARNNAHLIVNNTKKYLQNTNNITKIEVKFSDPNDPLNTGSQPLLKVKYSLKENE